VVYYLYFRAIIRKHLNMKIYRKSIIPLLLAVWTIAAITSLKAQLTGNLQQNSPIPFHESVRTGTLSNGM